MIPTRQGLYPVLAPRLLLVVALTVLLASAGGLPVAAPAATGDPSKAGAYCPFPKKGEKPACFENVERQYSAFFAAVESGAVAGEPMAELEQQLESAPTGEEGYLAVSSLAYGYYRLAERAAAAKNPDPALVARLQRWNALLSSVYAESEDKPELRAAVRDAAIDLHERAPAVAAECEPGSDTESCQTTGLLLRTLRGIDDPANETGVRGALSRLLNRVLGDDTEPTQNAASSEPTPKGGEALK